MEDTLNANPSRESRKEESARRTKEGRAIERRLSRLRSWLKTGKQGPKGYKREKGAPGAEDERKQIIKEMKELEREQKKTSYLKTRPKMGYVRYADDYLIALQQHSKAEAESVKRKVGEYLKTQLHVEQSEEKTLITHPTNKVKFLGYNLKSKGGRRKGLRLEIPEEAKAELLKEVDRLCKLPHIEEADLFLKVNDSVRGWMNYYRYATAPQRTFSEVLSKVFWKVTHYLATRHTTSVPVILKTHSETVTKNGRKRKTLRKWVKGKAIDLWMFPPKTERIYEAGIGQPEMDEKTQTVHEWAKGRSIERRIGALEDANYQCQECGTPEDLEVHHVGGLRGYRGTKNLARAGQAKEHLVLCKPCHLKVGHGGSHAPRNRGNNAA